MAKFTCPFCINEYKLSKVEYRCPDCGTKSEPKSAEREPIQCKNYKCGKLATLRTCPSCRAEIPKTVLETSNLPFSIVGVSNSGKTNYITVMLEELRIQAGLGLALVAQNKETSSHQTANRDLIYRQHVPPAATEAGARFPQIWSIRKVPKNSGNHVPTYTFTIFDGAGEDHENNLDISSPVCRYINASKAIMLTIDPLVLSIIRRGNFVDPDTMRNSLGGNLGGGVHDAEGVMNRVAEYIKVARGIKSTRRLDVPVAVVLTKFDTLLAHGGFAASALIRDRGLIFRDGKLNMTEIEQVHEEIRNWLYSIQEGAFVNAVQTHFKKFYFFGVSSFGAPPEAGQKLPNPIRPHRVLDPILWLFKNAGFID